MFAYAIALIFMGVLTFKARPPGVSWSSAWTAILVPGIGAALVMVCATLTARINSNSRNARIGVYLSLGIAVLMVVLPAVRLPSSLARRS